MTWRYFKFTESVTGPFDVYRCPDNGKRLSGQEDEDIQVFLPDGSWEGGHGGRLLMQAMEGWFSETSDQIDEAEAIVLMAKVVAAASAGAPTDK
jgi:hypothetical protein